MLCLIQRLFGMPWVLQKWKKGEKYPCQLLKLLFWLSYWMWGEFCTYPGCLSSWTNKNAPEWGESPASAFSPPFQSSGRHRTSCEFLWTSFKSGLSQFHCPGVFTGLWRAEAPQVVLMWQQLSDELRSLSNTSNISLQGFAWKCFGNSVWNSSFSLRTLGEMGRFQKRPKDLGCTGSSKFPVSCECFRNDSRLLAKAGLSGKALTPAALRGRCQISSRDDFWPLWLSLTALLLGWNWDLISSSSLSEYTHLPSPGSPLSIFFPYY